MDTVREALNSLVRPVGEEDSRGAAEAQREAIESGRLEGWKDGSEMATEGTESTEKAVVSEQEITGGPPVEEQWVFDGLKWVKGLGTEGITGGTPVVHGVTMDELTDSVQRLKAAGRFCVGADQYPEVIRLNLGAGDRPLEGWVNLDRKTGQEVYPLAFGDGVVDEIRASHVLEHFSHVEVAAVVAEWVRVLRPGGRLSIAVPDFELVAKQYLAGVPLNVQGYVMGGHVDADDRHGTAFDRETLHELLADSGLIFIEPWVSEIQDCASLPVSLNLRGIKAHAGVPDLSGTRAVLATARFGPALHHRCAYEALVKLGIPYQVSQGCFWHQILSELIEAAIADPECTRVLTLDFDTIFTREHVLELHRLMDAYPEAKAIVPVQSKRCSEDALFTMSDGAGGLKKVAYATDFNRNLTQINTGHFGLTLFDADALRKLARPWMCPEPSAAGRWRDGHVEADIDFWKNWKAAGRSVWLANRVRVGHLQEVITWPGEGFKPVHQSMNEFQLHGQPSLGG